VVLGPLVSVYVVNRQVIAQVRAQNRQQWINNLRSELVGVVASMSTYAQLKATGQLTDARVQELHEKLYWRWATIKLMINPGEADHAKLAQDVGALFHDIVTSTLPPEAMRARVDELIAESQPILKREWERVKAGA